MADLPDHVAEQLAEYNAQVSRLADRQAELHDGDMGAAGLDRLDLGPDPTPATITDALSSNSGCYYVWAHHYKEAQEEHAELVDDFEVWWSVKYQAARDTMAKTSSETAVKAKILSDEKTGEEYKKRKGAIAAASKQVEQLKYAMKAWEQRATLLCTMGGLMREELQATTREHVRGDERRGPRVNITDDDEPVQAKKKRKKKKRKKAKAESEAEPEPEKRHPKVPPATAERTRKPLNVVVDGKPPEPEPEPDDTDVQTAAPIDDDPDDAPKPKRKKKKKKRSIGGQMRGKGKGGQGTIPID